MARTMVTVNTISNNAATVLTKTVMTGGVTGASAYAIQGVKDDSKLRLVIQNPGATGTLEVKAPTSGGYVNSAIGDLEVTLGGGDIQTAIEIDGARFRNGITGTIDIDLPGETGILLAFQD